MKCIIVLFVSFFTSSALAQEDIKVTSLPKFSIRANVGIPKLHQAKRFEVLFQEFLHWI